LGEHSLELLSPLRLLPDLPARIATGLVRSARLYQAALWISEVDANQCWISLTSAVEAAANAWDERENTPLETLQGWNPGLVNLMLKSGGEDLATKAAKKLKKISGATWKFLAFLKQFRPDTPSKRPPEFWQLNWELSSFEAAMKKVYKYRSDALHGGTPFPAPMCWPSDDYGGAPAEVPMGGGIGMHIWAKEDLPVRLHLFEYIVRHTLLNWWKSCNPKGEEALPPLSVGNAGSSQ
jgi:hypothetical protein